jgi:hypothetical protein
MDKRTYNTMDQTKGQKDIQYNGPSKRTKGHTIQWTKQKDKRTYNTMDQTKGQKDIQYNGPNKRTKGRTI